MAADITIVAAGIVAAAQPGLASEALMPQHLLEPSAPVALAQAETPQIPADPLSSAEPQLELPPIALAIAPDFSTVNGSIGSPSVEGLAEVEALETQLINEQLGQAPIALPVAPPVVTSPAAIATPPLPVPQPALEPTALSGNPTAAYAQLTAVEIQIAADSVGIELPSQNENRTVAATLATARTTSVVRQETQRLQQQAQSLTRNIPVSGAIAVSPVSTSSQLTASTSTQPQLRLDAQRYQQAQVQLRDRFEAQLAANQIANQARRSLALQPVVVTPHPTSPVIAPTPDVAQRDLSPERRILAQVMMDSAEAQFLESSGLGTVEPSSAAAQGSGLFMGDDLGQVTSVSQLRDVQPTDWAYQATQSLIERYGCAAGYPDGSFRGDRALSRYEFAAGLNACLDRVTELLPIAGAEGGFAAREDLAVAQQLAEQFEAELSQVRGRVGSIEERQAGLEAQPFSTTTKLYGQSIFALRGSNNNDVDLFPVDGDPERSGAGAVTLGGSAELTLATSFRGNDLLLTTLQAGNIAASAPTQFTNMGRLSYESDTDNQLLLSDLSYRFAAAPNLGVIVGSHGVNPTNTFRGISPLEGSGDGALSRLGQRNPILELGGGSGGAGFDWQVSPSVSLQGIYSAASPNQTGNNAGLFNGGYVAGGQVAAGLGHSADFGLHYLHSYSPNGSLGTGIGDAQVLSPFASTGSRFRTHAVGATAAWRPIRHLTVGGWGGWTSSTPTNLSGSVQTTNWMGFAQVNDLFQQGNALGLLVGQPPKITSSNLPVGFNFPEFSDGGGRGGRRDTSLHLEAFYRTQLNDQISVTPGIVVVRNPNHNADNDTLVVGAMRTTFRF